MIKNNCSAFFEYKVNYINCILCQSQNGFKKAVLTLYTWLLFRNFAFFFRFLSFLSYTGHKLPRPKKHNGAASNSLFSHILKIWNMCAREKRPFFFCFTKQPPTFSQQIFLQTRELQQHTTLFFGAGKRGKSGVFKKWMLAIGFFIRCGDVGLELSFRIDRLVSSCTILLSIWMHFFRNFKVTSSLSVTYNISLFLLQILLVSCSVHCSM